MIIKKNKFQSYFPPSSFFLKSWFSSFFSLIEKKVVIFIIFLLLFLWRQKTTSNSLSFFFKYEKRQSKRSRKSMNRVKKKCYFQLFLLYIQRKKKMSSNNTGINFDFDPFDPSRKNCFLVEWRVTPNGPMADALAKAQQHMLNHHSPKIQVRQSCAADNFHITLNEFTLENMGQLRLAINVIQGFANEVMPRLAAQVLGGESSSSSSSSSYDGLKIQLDGLKDFRQDTFFVALKGTGVDFLQVVYREFHKLLFDAKLVAAAQPKRPELTAHMTMGRAQKGSVGESATWYSDLYADPYWKANIVSPSDEKKNSNNNNDLGEIVFCAKRAPNENQPPLIMKLFPPANKNDGAAAVASADQVKK